MLLLVWGPVQFEVERAFEEVVVQLLVEAAFGQMPIVDTRGDDGDRWRRWPTKSLSCPGACDKHPV